MTEPTISVCGDDLLEIAADGPFAAQHIAEHLRAAGGFREAVPGMASVVVQFDAAESDLADALQTLRQALEEVIDEGPAETTLIEVAVTYGGDDGPDFDMLCEQLGLTPEQLIALHTRDEYRVEMLGFTPGFAYIGGLDDKLNVPRLAEPRVRVPAGSVGIAGGRTGLYAIAGPAGWPIIGRTTLSLFDRNSSDPFRIRPGMRVRFRAVEGTKA